ncbi:MAG TPA: ankyrin repeat domain-containing protein [Gaiellales bacterium]|jgi:ankyrin repeat protein|nr:ankyrin repeat domain-containing protein [Gaiellales bacterium]
MTTPLPAAPSLEQLRKQAKELVREHRGDPSPLRLSDAQLALAREYGFPSWPRLKAYVERVSANGAALTHAFVDEIGYYEDRAEGLRSVVESGLENGIAIVRAYHPALPEASEAEIRALSPEDARLVLAREHGFSSWAAFRRHISSLADSGEPFRRAFRAIQARDAKTLGELLDRYPGLVTARGTNGNDLLGLAASAECGRRDKTIVRDLLARGADPNAANDRGWTPLHQAGYGNDLEMARLLLDAGASTGLYAHGEGGTPLAAALFWGHAGMADFLAEREVAPLNLRIAAGLGRLDLIDGFVQEDGSLSEAAGAARSFYRPHSGFPIWQPSDDSQEILDEALVWAAKSDRANVLGRLLELGANVDGDPYRGTALGWAAVNGRVASISRLLELRADVNHLGTFGGPDHGQGVTAMHLAAQSGQIEAVKALLAAGADPMIADAIHGGRPSGWADHGGHSEISKLLHAAETESPAGSA